MMKEKSLVVILTQTISFYNNKLKKFMQQGVEVVILTQTISFYNKLEEV